MIWFLFLALTAWLPFGQPHGADDARKLISAQLTHRMLIDAAVIRANVSTYRGGTVFVNVRVAANASRMHDAML